MDPKMSDRIRSAALKARRRASGLVRVEVYVPADGAAAVRDLARELCKVTEGLGE